MEVAYQFTQKRKHFGHQCFFSDFPATIIHTIPSTNERDSEYISRNPNITTVDATPMLAEHECNTIQVIHKTQGMKHSEGGWPENVDGSEMDQVDRYIKKATKDVGMRKTVAHLTNIVQGILVQNNTINVYERYFSDSLYSNDSFQISSEPARARGISVFRDAASKKRSVSCITWHPDGHRMAAAYSVLRFQGSSPTDPLPTQSYIWDLSNPNQPSVELNPPSPLVCLKFNLKTPDILIGGSYLGLVHTFDVRRPRQVVMASSTIDKSHHDPVYSIFWVQSKTNSAFASVSTDGRLIFWDSRSLADPVEVVELTDSDRKLHGATAMEYAIEAGPSKFLIGGEEGSIMSLNMKKKATKGASGQAESSTPRSTITTDAWASNSISFTPAPFGSHFSTVRAVQRNPFFTTVFATISDWCVRLWFDKTEKFRPLILQTPFAPAMYTACTWSSSRPSILFSVRADGVLDVWDFSYKHSAPVYTQKVSEGALTSVAVQAVVGAGGSSSPSKLLAIGDEFGSITLLELSDFLVVPQKDEKVSVIAMFEREARREENLEKLAMKSNKKTNHDDSNAQAEAENQAKLDETLQEIDTQFKSLLVEKDEKSDN